MTRGLAAAAIDAADLFDALGDDAAPEARRRTLAAIDAGDTAAAERWAAVEMLLHRTSGLVPPARPSPFDPPR